MMPRQTAATNGIVVLDLRISRRKAPDDCRALFIMGFDSRPSSSHFSVSLSPVGNQRRIRSSLVKDIEVNLLNRGKTKAFKKNS